MIGELLKNEREQKGLTLKDVERETSIRSAYIDAIEREDFAALPGEVYARGFVRNYANFLRLDSDEVVSQFRIDYNVVVRGATPEVPSKSSASRIFRKKKSPEAPAAKTQEPPIPSITTIPILTPEIPVGNSNHAKTPEPVAEHAQTSAPTYNESFSKPVVRATAKVESKIETAPETVEEPIQNSAPTVQDLIDGKLTQAETESNPAEEIQFNEQAAEELAKEEPTFVKPSEFDEHDMTLPNDQIRIEVDKESSWQKPAMVAAILAIIAGGGYFIYDSGMLNQIAMEDSKPKVETRVDTNREEKIQVKHATTDLDEDSTQISHNPITSTAQANPKEVELKAKFSDDCWISVVADGKEIFEGIASSGQTMSWKADQKIAITAGNAGAVELFKNGVSVGKAGAPGDVVEKVFNR